MKVRKPTPLTKGTLVLVLAFAVMSGISVSAQTVKIHPQHIQVPGIPLLSTPPTTSYCLTNFGIHCYQPFQLAKAYNLGPLHSNGIDGRGVTIVIVDSFGSPTIQNDLHLFDQTFGLPDPPRLTILQPAGAVPPFDPTNSDMVDWAVETTLDVEWAHVFAPGAAIVLVETPVSETEGVQGFPEIVEAENVVINSGIGDVIRQVSELPKKPSLAARGASLDL